MYEYLKEKAKDFPILYVEDNDGLREKAVKFFKKFFNILYVASNGEEGLEFYEKYQPKIVITDIKMPKLDGMSMAKKIKIINPNVKIIVTTAFDDKEFLITAIEVGVFRYVNKPFNIQEITQILTECMVEIDNQEKIELFNRNIQDIFNHQDNLLTLVDETKPTIANYNFLKFFDIDRAQDFLVKHSSFDTVFQEHEKFLYGKNVMDTIKKNPTSLYNVKMKKGNDTFHFILKVKQIPENEKQYIFSFSDITELGLLESFSLDDATDNTKLINLLKAIQNNDATVKIHNFYKGLSIANEAKILVADEKTLKVKTNYLQSRAVQFEKAFIISSKFLPKNILCLNVTDINYETQSITANDYRFIDHSPTRRKNVRVMPEDDHKIMLFYNAHKYSALIRDISIDAIRVRLTSIPAGLRVGEEVILNILLKLNGQDFIFKSNCKVFRVDTFDKSFDIVCKFNIPKNIEKSLVEYISKRQLALIREFKGLDREAF
jgi:YesN/AraC family two-component response regulator